MADALRLLFELDVDSRSGTAGLLRFRKDIAATIEATRRAITQPLKSLNTTPITAAAKASSAAQEKEQRRLNAAVQSLQRQRSAALIRAFKDEEKAAVSSARTQERAAQQAARAQERAAQQASRAITSAFRGIGPGLQSIGRTLTVGITAPLLALGLASLKSAKDLDANVNTLKAFTGSAEAAEKRLAELIKTARGTPGLTTNLALTLDAQLRVAKTTQETIDRVLPAIGRLNAVSKLPDPGRFVDNLKQLITQNFERQDLKELVGQSPLAGQLLTEIFNVDSPTNAKAIREQAKKLGLTSIDAFFNAFAEAAAKNQGLANVTESIGTRFDKIVDRVTVALRPLGLAILKAIEPFVEPVAKLVERIGAAFDSLSEPVKTAIIVIAGIAAAAGPVLFVLGGLATGITAVVSAIGTIAAAVAAVGLPAIAAAVGGIIVLVGEWAVILGALGLAWKTNFLGIRDLVSDAASAVLQAFGRIKAIIDEATQRILPTLQSITTKVLAIITAVWERYGKTVVAVVGTAFKFILAVTENFLKNFTDFVDLVLKLIDGDWQGAWNAFSRIVIRAISGLEKLLDSIRPIIGRAFARLTALIIQGAIGFVRAGNTIAIKLVAGLRDKLIESAPRIRDALIEVLALVAAGLDVTAVGAVVVGKLLAAMRKAAAQGVTVPVEFVPQDNLQRIELNPDGSIKTKKTPPPGGGSDGKDKGADAETRRRIRLLELEAERTQAINQQNIDAERLRFDLREKSLEQLTKDEIALEQEILEKKRKVFAEELIEAKKLGKGRELAVKEINLKSLQAEIEFHNKVNQLRVNQRKEEERAAIEHRQKLLDIQEQGDSREIARLEELSRQGGITAFERETRIAQIEAEARRRRRGELEKQLEETKENKEERGRIQDELRQFDEDSALATEEAERRKREALQETVRAYNAYARAIIEAQTQAAALIREASLIQLDSLRRRLGDRRRILREQFRIEQEDALDRHEANKRRIDDDEQAALEAAKKAGDIERRRAEIEKEFHDLRLAEEDRFNAEHQANQEAFERALDPLGPLKDRWDQFKEAVLNANDTIADSIQSVAVRISESFDSMVDALRQGIVAWILYGDSLGKALKKALAEQLANLAVEFAIQALKHGAYALGSLAFGDFAGAAKHAAAAAAFAAAAAATGFAARGLAKSAGLFKGSSRTTASAAVNGGEPSPNNRQFNFGGGGPVESSSRAAQEGSGGGFMGRLTTRIEQLQQQNLELQRQQQLQNAQVAQALTKLNTARPGDVVTMGAQERPDSIGVAVIDHSNASGDFNEKLQRNLGFA